MNIFVGREATDPVLCGAVRVEQCRQELERLANDVDRWISERTYADAHGRHSSQLASLSETLACALKAIWARLDAVPERTSVGETYEYCRDLETRALVVQRLWQFFASKWDQREDAGLRSLLAAADEVVWSCWAGPFRVLGRAPGPAPIPYIEPHFSAHATPRARPPVEFRVADGLLDSMIAKLPIPLIGLPPICASRPWWLVMIAHETGHHVAYDLLGEPLIPKVRTLLVEAAERRREANPEWPVWAEELFADAFAVACVGDAHLWAIEELELGDEQRMLADAGSYPPALARHAFNREMLVTLGGWDKPRQRPSSASPHLQHLFQSAGPVMRALVQTPLSDDESSSLRSLCDWRPERFTESGAKAGFSRDLLAARPSIAREDLAAARMVVAGSVAAWLSISREPEPARREELRGRLCTRTIDLITRCREPGVRHVSEPATNAGALAEELSKMLIDAPLEA
jgi:hypothetical protein